MIDQITVFLENKRGRIASLCRTLGFSSRTSAAALPRCAAPSVTPTSTWRRSPWPTPPSTASCASSAATPHRVRHRAHHLQRHGGGARRARRRRVPRDQDQGHGHRRPSPPGRSRGPAREARRPRRGHRVLLLLLHDRRHGGAGAQARSQTRRAPRRRAGPSRRPASTSSSRARSSRGSRRGRRLFSPGGGCHTSDVWQPPLICIFPLVSLAVSWDEKNSRPGRCPHDSWSWRS